MKVKPEKVYHVSNVIGCFLRKARKKMGLSSLEVAKNIGISQQHLSRFENGKSVINVEILFSLLILLKVCFSEFYNNIILLSLEDKVLSKYISNSDVLSWRMESLHYQYKAESII